MWTTVAMATTVIASLGAELRLGVRFGNIAATAHAFPIWVFASDSIQAESRLTGALELGVTLGYQR